MFFDVLTSFKNYSKIFIKNNLTNVKFSAGLRSRKVLRPTPTPSFPRMPTQTPRIPMILTLTLTLTLTPTPTP